MPSCASDSVAESPQEMVLGVFLGVFERIDFNPRLASCLATPMGQELRGAVQRALEDHKAGQLQGARHRAPVIFLHSKLEALGRWTDLTAFNLDH